MLEPGCGLKTRFFGFGFGLGLVFSGLRLVPCGLVNLPTQLIKQNGGGTKRKYPL